MKLAVGFITYNEATSKYLGDFLPSLEAALSFLKADDYQVYAFDNSDKANLENSRTLSRYPKIKYFCEGRNFGFARAYNILIREAIKNEAEYFLVINPDTIMEPEAIKFLAAALDNDGSLGAAAPKILRWDYAAKIKTDTIDSLGLMLGSGLKFVDAGQGMKDNSRQGHSDILGPSGAAGLFRVSALKQIAMARLKETVIAHADQNTQYFDERFFMYKEDCDLAYRLFLAGYKAILVSEAIVYHDRTAAVSGRGIKDFWRDRQSKSRKIRAWSFLNQHLLFLKHWEKQNLVNKIVISGKIVFMFLFSLILEQFLLKEYISLAKLSRGLTNIK